jgi:uncharacterized protein YndB with AHSA1/START domain
METARRVYEVYIRTTPEALWQAITDPEQTRLYWHGALSHSDWAPGARWTSESPEGELYLEGEIIEIEAPRRLVHTFHVVHEPQAASEGFSRLTWEIVPMGDACLLRLAHDDIEPKTFEYTSGGWEYILSGLKTLLETGTPLKVGAPSTM